MKKRKLFVIYLIFLIFIIACHNKDTKPELKEKELTEFLYKTIKWYQFWFNSWDNNVIEKLLTKKQNVGLVVSCYLKLSKWIEYYIYIEELKSIINITVTKKGIFFSGIEDDLSLKGTIYNNARDYFFKAYTYCGKIKEIKVGFESRKVFEPDKENNFNIDKEEIVEKVMMEFFQNSITFEGKTPEYEKILENKRAIIRVGNFYSDYPSIVFYIKNCIGDKPCVGEIIRDINNEVIANDIDFEINNLKKHKHAIDKLNKNGVWFIWENNEVKYISDIKKYIH